MGEERATRLDCLAVIADEELHDRVREVFDAWRLRFERVTELPALQQASSGRCRVVVVERRPGLRLYLERLRAAGAVTVVLGAPGPDVTPDIECVVRPSELVASVFRAQGRLIGLETGVAARVNQFAQLIAEQLSMPKLITMATAKTLELCEAEGASLLFIEPSTGGLYMDVEGGERLQLARGRGIAGSVAAESRARLVEDAQRSPDFDALADQQLGFDTGSIVAAPLVLGGEVLGVLMAARSTSAAPFSTVQLDRLVQLAPHVAVAVHNAQMNRALRTSQTQVIEANHALEEKVKERTQQISRAKQEWERTFDAIDAPIAVLDGFTIRRTNVAYARQVRRTVKEIPGKKCHEVFAGRATPCPGCPLLKGRGQVLGAEIETPPSAVGGRSNFFRFHGYWLSEEPRDSTVVVTYHDITQSHVLEEKLRESERLAAVGQLASGAAHEINNPLGFVTSNLRTLKGVLDELRRPLGTLNDALRLAKLKRRDELVALLSGAEELDTQTLIDGLEMIDESLVGAKRVGDIVKGLRELSRLEIGRREPANVNASVTRVVHAELGEENNVTLSLEARQLADLPPLQLDQVLGHLLRNAHLATPKKEKISVRTWQANGFVMVQVKDDGLGIARENLRRLFEPFFTTRGVGKGIGLGLTAAYGIVKRVGGDIEAQSEGPGLGSSFTVRLPLAEQPSLAEVA